MRYPGSEKLEIIRLVEHSHLPVRRTLATLGILPMTFYRWYARLQAGGPEALEDKRSRPRRVWNRIPEEIREQIVELALDEPELSPREVATRFTDVKKYFVSEASVYRLLNRVDRDLFRSRMSFPTVDDENPAVAAITYFYEPFLEAFDPQLREELGVWYTPPEIVRYQVRRIHHILKTDLKRARGLADPEVVVLDPCCGTGAYLLEVARCIAEELHIPVPRDAKLFERLANAGDLVAHLLDANADPREQVFSIIGEERAAQLAQLSKDDGTPINPADFKVTVNYWGGSKGGWRPRQFAAEEDPMPSWGDRTGELYIGDGVFFANVPEAVWKYELGGYPVLKKWLGYRQADRRSDEPLTTEERRWFKSIVQRIAALLALGPELDKLYSAASEDALTAKDLGLREEEAADKVKPEDAKVAPKPAPKAGKPTLNAPKPASKAAKPKLKAAKKGAAKKK